MRHIGVELSGIEIPRRDEMVEAELLPEFGTRLRRGLATFASDCVNTARIVRLFTHEYRRALHEVGLLALPNDHRIASHIDANGKRLDASTTLCCVIPVNMDKEPASTTPTAMVNGLSMSLQPAGNLATMVYFSPVYVLIGSPRPGTNDTAKSSTTKENIMSGQQPIIVRNKEGRPYRQGPALFKASGDETGGRFDFFEMTIEYLTGPGLHYHLVQDDTFYVLEGVLAVQHGDEVVELEPGDFITVPPGMPHTFDNIRKDQPPVKVINLMTPAGYEGLFAANEHLEAGADQAVYDKINAEHNVKYVGPPLRVKLGLE